MQIASRLLQPVRLGRPVAATNKAPTKSARQRTESIMDSNMDSGWRSARAAKSQHLSSFIVRPGEHGFDAVAALALAPFISAAPTGTLID